MRPRLMPQVRGSGLRAGSAYAGLMLQSCVVKRLMAVSLAVVFLPKRVCVLFDQGNACCVKDECVCVF